VSVRPWLVVVCIVANPAADKLAFEIDKLVVPPVMSMVKFEVVFPLNSLSGLTEMLAEELLTAMNVVLTVVFCEELPAKIVDELT
jgi:hypothetical protein